MITIISGAPGAGKTAYVVSELQAMYRGGDPGRPIFVLGIPGLELPVATLSPVKDWTRSVEIEEDENVREFEFTFPDGSLIVIDEAQKVYRPRTAVSKPPPHVVALEKHRHRGLDFWLVTQAPNLLDAQVRYLTGRHIHLRSSWSGRTLYEWPEAASPGNRSDLSRAATRRYSLPKSAFGAYRSASMHLKPERRRPLVVYVLVGLIGLALVLGWVVVDRVRARTGLTETQDLAETPSMLRPQELSSGLTSGSVRVLGAQVSDYVPRVSSRPETAPLYDSLRQPKQMPTIRGCMTLLDECRCYTSQGTRVHVTKKVCLAWLNEPPFDPWRDPGRPADVRTQADQEHEEFEPVAPGIPVTASEISRVNI